MTSGSECEEGRTDVQGLREVEYQREPSLPLLCVPACLNMILARRGYLPMSQVDIACRLGLVAPKRWSDAYPFAETSENGSDWGIRPATAEVRIKEFLRERAPTVHHAFRRWQEVPSSSHLEFIEEHLASGSDVAVGFRASDIYDDAEPVGHVALIMGADSRRELVRLMDPEEGNQYGVVVPWGRLLSGIIAVRDGYWLFGESPTVLAGQPAI